VKSNPSGSGWPASSKRANALVRGIAAGEQLAGQQQALAGFPAFDLRARQAIERHTPALASAAQVTFGHRSRFGGSKARARSRPA
jgi:hypothetical protein